MDPKTPICRRVAQELRDGMLVDLGIGLPCGAANHVPAGMQVFSQDESGIIRMGARPIEAMEASDLAVLEATEDGLVVTERAWRSRA